MRRLRGGRSSTLFVLLLTMSGCALIAGVGDYEVADVATDRGDEIDGAATVSTEGGADATAVTETGADASDARPQATPLCDVNDPSLVLCFDFEGDTTDKAGTPDAVTVQNVTFAPGVVGQGARFDGATSTMFAAGAPKLTAMTLVTLEAFVTLEVAPTSGRQGVIDSNSRFGMFVVPGGFVCTNTQATSVQTTTPLTVGKPTHLACVRDGTTLTAYQDGVPVGAAAAAGTITAANEMVAIGSNSPSGEVFHGVLDEVRVYGRPKTAAEIATAATRAR